MDNKAIAGILYETAALLEIDGQDSFRIRSYRNAAEAIEALPQQIAELIGEPKKVLAIPGIGKGMLANLQEMFKDGRLSLHAELLKKYHPSMLDLLKIQGLGPKTIALIWSAYQVASRENHRPSAKLSWYRQDHSCRLPPPRTRNRGRPRHPGNRKSLL
jgi:DNA polymerase (family 10)